MSRTHTNRTKIVATIGPACSEIHNLRSLFLAGVNVCRLNFSHGAHEEHLAVIENIRTLNKELKSKVAILADLQGPKIRIGDMQNNGVELKSGHKFTLTNHKCVGDAEKAYLSYQDFPLDVEIGDNVLMDDGKLKLEVIDTNRVDTVVTRIVHGGILSSKKGVNLPNTNVSIPSLTEKDLIDLEFIITQKVDWIALSFVRSGKDIKELRERLIAANCTSAIIAKIEKPQAIDNLDEIIEATDGIMVARGDLGVEYPIEKMPMIQKLIVEKSRKRARPVIIATQMMESMITNFMPTRAEANDVGNSVLDGADALMLSGETSVGKHPVRVIEYMEKIIAEVESHKHIYDKETLINPEMRTFLSDVLCKSATETAKSTKAAAIICMTKSGYTAIKISSLRPESRIFVFTNNLELLTKISLVWGVKGFYYDKFISTDQTIEDVNSFLLTNGYAATGDVIINTGSMPIHERQRTNMVKVSKLE